MANFRTLISGLTRVRSSFSSINNHPRYFSSSLVNGISSSALTEKLLVRARFLSSGGVPSHLILEMPALSPTMNQGNIAKWRKKEGDKIDVGDVICEIETGKTTLEFECLEEGFLAKILAPEGSKDVLVGNPIAITVEDPEDIKNLPAEISRGVEAKGEPSTQNIKQDLETIESTQGTGLSRISPSAKLLIAEHKLDPSSLKASGPHGTLLKGDVLSALHSRKELVRVSKSSHDSIAASTDSSKLIAGALPQSAASTKTNNHEDIPNSQIRKVIAKRLLESKQNTPHFYLSADVALYPLLVFRKDLQEKHNVKVSVNDIVIKAVALALKNVPEANGKDLMTPIIRNADQKTLSAISFEVKELAEKARAGKLKPEQFQGGTFSISNLGMFPVDSFCAIINPPQACILAVGSGNKVVEAVIGSDGSEKPAVVTKMCVTLSADHRVFDVQLGGKFLSALSSNFSDVRRLLL